MNVTFRSNSLRALVGSMTSRTRRSIGSQRNPASEEAILAAAHEILATEGVGGFTIEAVARRARAGKPTVYRWWPSRAHLLFAVFEREKEPFREPDTGSLEGDLMAYFRFILGCYRDTPAGNIFRSIIAEAQASEVAAQALAQYNRSRRERNAEWLSKHMPGDEALALADLMSAYVFQRLSAGELDPEDEDTARAARYLARAGRETGDKAARARRGRAS